MQPRRTCSSKFEPLTHIFMCSLLFLFFFWHFSVQENSLVNKLFSNRANSAANGTQLGLYMEPSPPAALSQQFKAKTPNTHSGRFWLYLMLWLAQRSSCVAKTVQGSGSGPLHHGLCGGLFSVPVCIGSMETPCLPGVEMARKECLEQRMKWAENKQ